ncbi:MAG: rod shape-determining protein MreC [Candidatus Cloacimonetes bacterium]|nr:rod shape-determining protein MreC [Candidatus Cloacimonadota bacterium]
MKLDASRSAAAGWLVWLALCLFSLLLIFTGSSYPALRARDAVLVVMGGPLGLFSWFPQQLDLAAENRRLRRHAVELFVENSRLRELALEGIRLEHLLGVRPREDHAYFPARVIARGSALGPQSVVLDRGSADGIRPGDALVTAWGLAGAVTSTTGAVSQGFLLGHREFRARAMVQRTRDEGIVAGMGSNELRLLDISLSSDIQVDDLVVTSGKSSRFPEGIPIGVVVSNEVTGGLFRDVRVRALASLSRLEELYIVQPVPADSASLVPVDSASDTDLPGATHRQNQNGSE